VLYAYREQKVVGVFVRFSLRRCIVLSNFAQTFRNSRVVCYSSYGLWYDLFTDEIIRDLLKVSTSVDENGWKNVSEEGGSKQIIFLF
jgi:hypothetical protein